LGGNAKHKLKLTMYEVVLETIVWTKFCVFQGTKFGIPLGEQTPPNGPPKVKFLNCST